MEALRRCRAEGTLVASELVWAELAAAYPQPDAVVEPMGDLGVGLAAIDIDVALHAGGAWSRYRAAGGPRSRVLPDFLIGAHALLRAERLLTRDRGFIRRYFPDLDVIDPTEGAQA
jgi:predicted nucleic acid-binding protein